MCGIIGEINSHQKKLTSLAPALKSLHHRGPDVSGTWISKDKNVQLGHARLSIMDLDFGVQPLISQDQMISCVVNGEFYDFERIRSELQKEGFHFKTNSDSEILLHLYQKKGISCLDELRGEFSFILYDQRNDFLIAARDRFGVKPLFYHFENQSLKIASEVKAIKAMGISLHWNEKSFAQIHTGMTLDTSTTLYQNISQVPPGNYLIFNKGDLSIKQYWDIPFPENESEFIKLDKEEATKRTSDLIEESIKLRLRSDVEVGVYLSGGIDSCSILGKAQKLTSKNLKAYTLSFDQEEYDERAIAERMAKHCGAEFNPIDVTQQKIVDNYESALRSAETIFVNTHGVAKYILSKKVNRDGLKVVLTGEGSDEVFAGYPIFRQDLLMSQMEGLSEDQISQKFKELSKSNDVSKGLILADDFSSIPLLEEVKKIVGFIPSQWRANVKAGGALMGFMNPDFKERYNNYNPFLDFTLKNIDLKIRNFHPLNRSLYAWSKSVLPNYILSVLGDRMEMGNSVEGRVPFLDHHLVEFVSKIDIHHKINGMNEKYILREACKDVLTEEVYSRQKHPFLAPPSGNKNDHLFEFMADMANTYSKDIPFYSSKAISAFIDQIPKMDQETKVKVDPLLNILTSICVLHKTMISRQDNSSD